MTLDDNERTPEYDTGFEAGYEKGHYDARTALRFSDIGFLILVSLMALRYFNLI